MQPNPFGATIVVLLIEFTVAELAALSRDQPVDLNTHRGHSRLEDPAVTTRAVQEALRSSYPIDPQMDTLVTTTLAMDWEHIRQVKHLMKRLDQRIARATTPMPNPLFTMKRLGAGITADILVEIVDIARFPGHKHVAQSIGLTLQKGSTGNWVSQNTRVTKVGNPYLLLFHPGRRAIASA